MKQRSGFVSNSSSSSFIVAFPRKPKCPKDVFDMLFGESSPEDNCVPRWCDKEDTEPSWIQNKADISEQVFSDIQRRCPKGTKLVEIAEQFEGRYYYHHSGNVVRLGDNGELIPLNGWDRENQGKFFGTNSKLLDKLEELEKEEEAMSKRHNKEQADYINAWLSKKGVKIVDDYHDPEWNKYRAAYQKALESLHKRSKPYKAFLEKQWEERRIMWDKMKKARTKVAKADARAMMEAHKDAFIANFEYGDNHGDVSGGIGTVLEQGTVWDNIPHIKINHH